MESANASWLRNKIDEVKKDIKEKQEIILKAPDGEFKSLHREFLDQLYKDKDQLHRDLELLLQGPSALVEPGMYNKCRFCWLLVTYWGKYSRMRIGCVVSIGLDGLGKDIITAFDVFLGWGGDWEDIVSVRPFFLCAVYVCRVALRMQQPRHGLTVGIYPMHPPPPRPTITLLLQQEFGVYYCGLVCY